MPYGLCLGFCTGGLRADPAVPVAQVSDVTFKTGDTLYHEPVTHSAENIGKTMFHAIIVELKTP